METENIHKGESLFLNIGLGFYVELSPEEAKERIPDLINLAKSILKNEEKELLGLLNFRNRVDASLQSLEALVN